MTNEYQPVVITHEQARRAFSFVYMIVRDAFDKGEQPIATQINLHPDTVKQMRNLVEEAESNDQ